MESAVRAPGAPRARLLRPSPASTLAAAEPARPRPPGSRVPMHQGANDADPARPDRWLIVSVAVVAVRSSRGGRCPRRLADRGPAPAATRPLDGSPRRTTPERHQRRRQAGRTHVGAPSGTRDDHLDAPRRHGDARRSTGHHLAHPVERERRPGHPDRRRQLPELRRPDRGHVQRAGGADELSGAEHLHRHRPAHPGRRPRLR